MSQLPLEDLYIYAENATARHRQTIEQREAASAERDRAVLALVDEGESRSRIAKRLKLSKTRIDQIVARARDAR